jgi:hypothetical protein
MGPFLLWGKQAGRPRDEQTQTGSGTRDGKEKERKPLPWYSKTRSGGGWFVPVTCEEHHLATPPKGGDSPTRRRVAAESPGPSFLSFIN